VGGATRRYYRLGDQLVLYDGTAYHYLYGDHLNSATLTTNVAGVKTSETRYYPYGAHRYDWGSDPSDRDFTGQRRDAEAALLDYVARRYSPYLGRFISPDSIIPNPGNPQDLNRYSYARNNPLKYTDPSGHIPIVDWIKTAWKIMFFVGEHTEITRGMKPEPEVSPQRQEIARTASAVAVSADTVATSFSTMGSALEIGSALVAGGSGAAVGLKSYYEVVNPIENGASAVGLVATCVSDFAAGNSQIGMNSITIGQDSLISTAAVGAGNLLPFEGVTDTAINVPQLAYDANRAGGKIPTYFEFKWSKGRPWYIKIYLNQPDPLLSQTDNGEDTDDR